MDLSNLDFILRKSHPLLLDGGLSNVLEAQGHDLNHKLWTARLLAENPEAIIQAHLAYLKAGAQYITTASYQASIAGLTDQGYTLPAAEQLIKKSVDLALKAIEQFLLLAEVGYRPYIAASIGPYGAYLADGSEYRGNYGVSAEDLRTFHQENIRLLDQTAADFLACETIPSLREAQVLASVLLQTKKPAWASFSCKDDQCLNDGSPIEAVVDLFVGHSKVFAIGVNCTHPKYISGIIKKIKDLGWNKGIIVYPNSGEAYNSKTKTWMGLSQPAAFVAMSEEWLHLGANIIGGCCRIGPEHIEKMSGLLSTY